MSVLNHEYFIESKQLYGWAQRAQHELWLQLPPEGKPLHPEAFLDQVRHTQDQLETYLASTNSILEQAKERVEGLSSLEQSQLVTILHARTASIRSWKRELTTYLDNFETL